ncbi:MAG: UDP-N-acetylmuramoyl-L-alanyl-D-glutamate--2,6-diaminopimelate ligase [Rhodospirillales bacterium]
MRGDATLRLTDLLEGAPSIVETSIPLAGIDITGLASDSRRVEPGYLFAALPGTRADGRAFLQDAVRRGAVAVLAPPGTSCPPAAAGSTGTPVALITDDNPRRRLALLAARFFGRQPATVAAVTGTNGKTSVVWFLRQIWAHLGRPAASLGTLGLCAPGLEVGGSLTTPDPVDLHATLARLADAGVDCLAMEASSHGLAQHRLDGVRIAAAAFTNLTRDHLDFHGTSQAYLAAKTRLFSEVVAAGGTAVINADSPEFPAVAAAAAEGGLAVLGYGGRGADLAIDEAIPVADGQRLRLTVRGEAAEVVLPLVGDFQAGNALAALGLAIATGSDARAACAALTTLQPVPGRLERAARRSNGAAVYVDYAHTPDALAAVLRALRPQTTGRLVVVFGCGGDRDRGKRPEMGRIAARLADRVIVTDDNPRSEPAAAIRRDVRAGCPDAIEIGDRGEAIGTAVAALEAGDVLVVAGKGHETGQIVGDRVLPFDDARVARVAVAEADR